LAWWSTRSKNWVSGFDRVTESPGSILIFLNQNHVVLVKKNKSQWVATKFLIWSCRVAGSIRRVISGFDFLYFFKPDPVPVPDRPGPESTHRAGPVSKLWPIAISIGNACKLTEIGKGQMVSLIESNKDSQCHTLY